jgi:hypothetical protein
LPTEVGRTFEWRSTQWAKLVVAGADRGAGSRVGGSGGGEELAAHEIQTRVVGRHTAGPGADLGAADLEPGLLQRVDQLDERGPGGGGVDRGAPAGGVVAVVGVEAAADPHAVGVDLQVVADSGRPLEEPALGGLVGRLVLAEPDVPVGPEHDRGGAELRRERFEQRAHRRADRLVVHVLVRRPVGLELSARRPS